MGAWKEFDLYRTENNKYFISFLCLHCLRLHGQMLLCFILLLQFENCNCSILWCMYVMSIWVVRRECVTRSTFSISPNVSHPVPSVQWAVEKAHRVEMLFAERCWKPGALLSWIPHSASLCHSHPWSGPAHWTPVQVSGKGVWQCLGKRDWKSFTKKSMLFPAPQPSFMLVLVLLSGFFCLWTSQASGGVQYRFR